MLFADTSFWIAFLRENDQFHTLALEIYRDRIEPVCTTNWVLVELANYFASRRSRSDCGALIRELVADQATVVVKCETLFDASLDLYHARQDKEWSLTDCSSFIVMEDLQIQEALTADHHFEQAGFEILLK